MLVIFVKCYEKTKRIGANKFQTYIVLWFLRLSRHTNDYLGSLLVSGNYFVVFLPSQYRKYPIIGLNNNEIIKNGLGGIRTLDLTLRRHPRCPFCAFCSLRYEPLSIKQQ